MSGVLFDLDGTLLDTAHDMSAALNVLRSEEGCAPLPFETIRVWVSHGSTALIRLGFPGVAAGPAFEELRQRFLDIYRRDLAVSTRLYAGLEAALERLDVAGVAWGIVTNKPGWLTEPLLEELDLRRRPGVLVCGDTLTTRKPDPAPLLYAARSLDLRPGECIYVGDAERDVLAAKAAGMPVYVALFGYIPAQERPHEWPADGWLSTPGELSELLGSLTAA
ncbi:MAG TPA: phosphoglycolate phosphatase [Steroidobacteraceae bacterium]|nr:phosphoglycolate phosphatase [Steroidobacteraceae bacterium]